MQKTTLETILAGIIGIIIGVISASGFWYLKGQTGNLSKAVVRTNRVSVTKDKAPTKSALFLNIDSPTNESLLSDNKTKIMGKTNQGNTVIVSQNGGDKIFLTQNGDISEKIELNEGVNLINISALDGNNNSKSQRVYVVYEASKQ